MAEDDKYVPSNGNKQLDPTALRGSMTSRAEHVNKLISDQNKEFDEKYETDADGTVRAKGYWQTKGGQATAKTRADRAHISERTWGKYNRGETMDMYGNKRPSAKYVNAPKPSGPPKKSDINKSMSPEFGQLTGKGTEWTNGDIDSKIPPFSGALTWIGRFPPDVCGPVLVSSFGNRGGYYQSNAQESANNGRPINSIKTWG